MIPKITVWADHDIVSTAHVTAGINEMARLGLADVHWRLPKSFARSRLLPIIVKLSIVYGQCRTNHVFDFHDSSSWINNDALGWSDYYWKANFNQSNLKGEEQQHKIVNYGLYYPTRSSSDRAVSLRVLGSAISSYQTRQARGISRLPMSLAMETRRLMSRYKRYKGRLTVLQYESTSLDRANAIYFNPGCWSNTSDSSIQVNEYRYRLIKTLRQYFGDRFVGGFVPNATAQKYYADAVYESVVHSQYIQNLQDSHIVVTTNGIDGCHSWRTGEAVAAGAIIVAEKPRNRLDVSSSDGFFTYDNIDECISMCDGILTSTSREVVDIHRAMFSYNAEYVSPGRSLMRKLERYGQ